WTAYKTVLTIFAEESIKQIREKELVWVHDYHLMGLARVLREKGIENKLAFFLHIPFPAPEIYFKLPWRKELIEELLQYDLIGFQTERDLANFASCVEKLTEYELSRETIRSFKGIK